MTVCIRADDGVDRTGLDAQGTADAGVFDYDRHLFRFLLGIQRFHFAAKQVGQLAYAIHAPRRTLVDVCLARGNRLRVGFATGVAALTALRLRQDRLDLLDHRVALDLEPDRRIAEGRAKDDGTECHDRQGNDH